LEVAVLDEALRPHLDAAVLFDIFGKRAGCVGKSESWSTVLFKWADLDEIIAANRLKPPRLRIVNGAAETPDFVHLQYGRRGVEIPRVRLEPMYKALREGGTLILDAIDELHAGLRTVTRGFARTFGSIPQTNVYASFGTTPGFGIHWDDHDVFVVQLSGSKHWKVYHSTRDHPMYRDLEPPERPAATAEPYFDEIIEAGSVIYVPRGHWHDVVGVGEASLHLTIGITHPTPSDVLIWLADQIKASPALRADIPLFSLPGRRTLEHELLTFLEESAGKNLFDAYLAYRRHTLGYRAEPSLLSAITRRLSGDATYHWLALTDFVRQQNGAVEVRHGGQIITLDSRCATILEQMSIRKSGRIGDLTQVSHKLSAAQVATIVLALVDIGAVSVRE
jgi:hypothetical protein